ncbi:MAG: hypothetical protein KME05_16525 [Gloeocapsa sp. UFS-A4-WI-NPMV-4B04]|jgi:ElaB/YqjD/DUF883 family membrane-anchored ribosome-binding protein|nr:hypothetical protein [Gloeocapsa sp. UFS-A4-WI-NPMV-4B04]
MNRIIAGLKKVRLRQILMTCLAGLLLFVSTACNNGGSNTGLQGTRQEVPSGLQSETGAKAKVNPRPEVPGGTATSPDRNVINRFEGGTMNEFSDIDPRTKQAGAAADKASTLIENAERNVIDQTSDIGENTKRIFDKKGENADDLGKNLQKSAENTKYKAQNTADNLGRAAKQGAENVKDSTVNATKDATKGLNQATSDVKDNSRGLFSGLNRSANRAGEDVKESVRGAARNTGNDLVDSGQQTIEKTGNFVQDKLNQAARGTQRSIDKSAQNTLNKAGNAIEDAID